MGFFFWHRTGGYAIPHCKTIALCFRKNRISCPEYDILPRVSLLFMAHRNCAKVGSVGSQWVSQTRDERVTFAYSGTTLYFLESALQQLCNGVSHAPVRLQEPTWDVRAHTPGIIIWESFLFQISTYRLARNPGDSYIKALSKNMKKDLQLSFDLPLRSFDLPPI